MSNTPEKNTPTNVVGEPDIDMNYGRCEACDTALDPFNRMHINWHFVCRECFYKAERAEKHTQNLVKAVFDHTPRFVFPRKETLNNDTD